jgi:hypothetical protein
MSFKGIKMSRSGYYYDNDNINLWRENVERTIKGKRGQAFLKDLLSALEAMPEKRLISGELVSNEGDFCALGVIGHTRKIDLSSVDPEDPDQVGDVFKISSMLAQEIVYINDEWMEAYRLDSMTPEERWSKVHEWVLDNIVALKND